MTGSEETTTTLRRKKYGCCGKSETNAERCRRLNKFYQARYPDVPALGSQDLVRSYDSSSTVLVDVRTKPERNVSRIKGAVSLQEFEEEHVRSLQPETKVVTYCTIGYRSGLEARRLQYQYSLKGRISSLDGIVAYTHALSNVEEESEAPKVIDPNTGMETTEIHTFGSSWDCVDGKYHPRHFSHPMIVLRYLQVGGTVVWRTIQYLFHNTRHLAEHRRTSKME